MKEGGIILKRKAVFLPRLAIRRAKSTVNRSCLSQDREEHSQQGAPNTQVTASSKEKCPEVARVSRVPMRCLGLLGFHTKAGKLRLTLCHWHPAQGLTWDKEMSAVRSSWVPVLRGSGPSDRSASRLLDMQLSAWVDLGGPLPEATMQAPSRLCTISLIHQALGRLGAVCHAQQRSDPAAHGEREGKIWTEPGCPLAAWKALISAGLESYFHQ